MLHQVLFSLLMVAATIYPASAADLSVGLKSIGDNLHPYAPGLNEEALNFYSRPMMRPTNNQGWECYWCEKIPSVESGTLKVEKRGRLEFLTTTWTFKAGAQWADGSPITSEDVLFTWQVLKALADAGILKHQLLYDIDDIKATKNPRTFQMTHIGYNVDFEKLASFYLLPSHLEAKIYNSCNAKLSCYMEQTLYRKEPTKAGLTNGPFQIIEFTSPLTLKLKRVKQTKAGNNSVTHITARAISRVDAAELQQLDLVLPGILTTSNALELERQLTETKNPLKKAITFHYPESTQIELLVFNLRHPILSDLTIREAINLAINRKAILQKTFAGGQRVAHSLFDHPLWPTSKIQLTEPSTAQAIKLLDEQGWDIKDGHHLRRKENQILSFEILVTAENRPRAAAAALMKSALEEVGIGMTVKEVTPAFFTKTVLHRAEFRDLLLVNWRLTPGGIPKNLIHSKEVPSFSNHYYGQNIGAWRNGKVDKLLDRVEDHFGKISHQDIINALTQEIQRDLPFIPLYFTQFPSIQKNHIESYTAGFPLLPSSGFAENWTKGVATP